MWFGEIAVCGLETFKVVEVFGTQAVFILGPIVSFISGFIQMNE